MRDFDELPPYLASEVSSRLLKVDPRLRMVFALDEVPIDGRDFEKLLCAVWLAGYGEALGDVGETMTEQAQAAMKLPPLAAWIEEYLA